MAAESRCSSGKSLVGLQVEGVHEEVLGSFLCIGNGFRGGCCIVVGSYIRDTHRATGVAGVMFGADGPRVELFGFHVADSVP